MVQARAIETRQKILTQAEVAFARFGFDATSLTSDILDPAGVSVGSFYHQFDNKIEVLLAVLADRLEERRSSIAALLASTDAPFEGSLRIAMDAALDDIDRSPESWQISFRERQHPDPTISTAIEYGWEAWSEVGRSLVARHYQAPPAVIGDAAQLTISVTAGLMRDYLGADAAGRERVRARVPVAAEFAAAGVERLVGR